MNKAVSQLLFSLGLQEYEASFIEAALDDLEVIRELTEEDLEKLGLKMGHRKKLIKALEIETVKEFRAMAAGPRDCSSSPTTSTSMASERSTQSLKIFMSYGRDEFVDEVHAIRDALCARGHEVWFDSEQLAGGLDWEQRIEAGLSWCDQLVLTLTPHSVRRPDGYCLNELAKALELRKPIIPVLLTQVPLGVPTSICRIQYLDWRDAVPAAVKAERFMQRMVRLFEAIEENKLDFEGGQQRLIRYLQPINYDADIQPHVARFQGRKNIHEHLRNWLFDTSPAQVLWLTGGPGVGKSAIAATLAHRWAEVGAVHFCVAGNQDKIDPARTILSIAFQLSNHLEAYRARLYHINLEREAQKDGSTLFDTILVAPLAKDFPAPDQPCIVLLDGLDEAKVSISDNPLAEIICGGWSKLPKWLRLIVSSRPEADVTPWLSGITRIELRGDDPEHQADLAAFVGYQLNSMNRSSSPEVIKWIVSRSEGAYHYVVLLLEEVRQGRCDPENPVDLPSGLNQFYLQTFRRRFKDVVRFQIRTRALFELILAAPEPVPLSILALATKMEVREVKEELCQLGSLVLIEPNQGGNDTDWDTVRLSHASLRSWLIAIDDISRQPIAGPYSAKPDIASLAIVALDQWEREFQPDGPDREADIQRYGFVPRSLWALLKAAFEAKKIERAVLDRTAPSLAKFWRSIKLQFALDPAKYAVQSSFDSRAASVDNSEVNAQSLFNLATLGTIYRQMGKYDLALSTFSQLIEILSPGFALGKLRSEEATALGNGWLARGELYLISGEIDHARHNFQEALKTFEWQLDLDTSNLEALFQVGISHYQAGGTYEADGDLPKALVAYQKSKSIFFKLNVVSPENLLWLSELGSISMWTGAILEAQGNVSGALHEYRDAKNIIDKALLSCKESASDVFKATENLEYYKIVCLSYLAGSLELNGFPYDAIDVFSENMSLAISVFYRDTENVLNRREVAAAAAYLSKAHLTIGDKEKAKEYFEQSFTHFDHLRNYGDPGSLFDWAVTLALGIEVSSAVDDIATRARFQNELALLNFSSKGIGTGLFLKRFWPLLRHHLEDLSKSQSLPVRGEIEYRIADLDKWFGRHKATSS